MPNLVRCPKCNGGVLIDDIATAARLDCPLCADSFVIAELPNQGIPLTFAREAVLAGAGVSQLGEGTFFADVPEAEAMIRESECHDEGSPSWNESTDTPWQNTADEPQAIQDFGDEGVIAGVVETPVEAQWCYPGCEPSAEENWSAGTATAEGMVAAVAMVPVAPPWCYPGCDSAEDAVAEVTSYEAPFEPLYRDLPSDEDEIETYDEPSHAEGEWSTNTEGEFNVAAPAFDGPSFAGIGDAAAPSTATGPVLRTSSKKRKSKEVNPIFLAAGIMLGGVLGLSIGYLILVALRGAELDFLHLFY